MFNQTHRNESNTLNHQHPPHHEPGSGNLTASSRGPNGMVGAPSGRFPLRGHNTTHFNTTNPFDNHEHGQNITHFNGSSPFQGHGHNGTHLNTTNPFESRDHGHNVTQFNVTSPFQGHGHNATHLNGSDPHHGHNATHMNHSHPFGHEVRSIGQHSVGVALTPDMLFIWMILLCLLCSWISDQFSSSYNSAKTAPRHHVLDYMSASASLERPATFHEFCSQSGLEPTAEEKPMLQSTFDSMQSSLHGHTID